MVAPSPTMTRRLLLAFPAGLALLAALVATPRPASADAPSSTRRSGSENGRSKIQCPRPGRPGSVCKVHNEPSGRRLARKCRSSKTSSVPSGTVASTAPHTVTASTPAAPRSRSAQMFA